MSKNLMLLALAVSLVIGVVLAGGCAGKETPTVTETQIIEVIAPQEAFTLIQDNANNPDFVIIDIRTLEEFAEGHIANAINIDYYSETFTDELNNLDKNKVYLIYCQWGNRSGAALAIMEGLNFREVYAMSGGIDAWQEEELPVVTE